jgi:hypothetical protein
MTGASATLLVCQNGSDGRTLSERPDLLWGLIPVILIWTLRVWNRAVHGRMNEDPLMFAMHDRFSLCLAVFSMLILFFAWLPA